MNLIALKQPEEVLTTSPYQDLALGPLVGKLSKKMKVKQTEIGKSAGISRISINRFFRGKSEVRASDLVEVLRLLGIDVEGQIREKLSK
tara:strand:- start:1177 stop:1443 length:267 start_codon:yes stop_codon:yes gene_type:complete